MKYCLTICAIAVLVVQAKGDSGTVGESIDCQLENGKRGFCVPEELCGSMEKTIKECTPITVCSIDDNFGYKICCAKEDTNYIIKCYDKIPRSNSTVPFIYGGEDALRDEFPHMAALGYGRKGSVEWACGGSLISEKFILTAAHCLIDRTYGEVTFARLGATNLDDTATVQEFEVINRIKHPDYKRPSTYNDIGLIELERPAQITDSVKLACLYTILPLPKNDLVAMGWGEIPFSDRPKQLQKINLKRFAIDECDNAYKTASKLSLRNGIVNDLQICAGEKGKDTCNGDSGGPLVISYVERYAIVGITSIGKKCGIADKPGIYTRVSQYIEWIESHIS